MTTQKLLAPKFTPKPSLIGLAFAASFSSMPLYAQTIQELITPDQADASVNLMHYDSVNPLYRQFNGVNQSGLNGHADINVVNRNESGTWLQIQGQNLGLSTQEFGAKFEKQGDWSVGVEYNQIPRYAPYEIQTGVSGIGTNTVTQPNRPTGQYFTGGKYTTAPALFDTTLKTERDITTLTGTRFISDQVKVSLMFKNEDKTGARMSGVRGATSATATNIYQAFIFAPEPINQNHTQIEAIVDYVTSKFQLSGGYYSSFLNNKNSALTVTGGTNTMPLSQTGIVGGVSPLALPPDNSLHQFFANGGYNFSKDTRGTFKVAYSEGIQNADFIAYSTTAASTTTQLAQGTTGASLQGRVQTTEAFASLSSRINQNLKLLGSWRYEDKQDQTRQRLTKIGVTNCLIPGNCNNPESHVANRGKLEADYLFGDGYGLTLGYDLSDKHSDQWRRRQVSEETSRIALRKAMSETINGSIRLSNANKTGSDWTSVLPIYPVYLANRQRQAASGMIDWATTENLNLQFSYEAYRDDYQKSTYGLESGEGNIYSVDAIYSISDTWKVNAWYALQTGQAKQVSRGAICTSATVGTTCTASISGGGSTPGTSYLWDGLLSSNSDQFGFGITGSWKKFDLSAQYLYSADINKTKTNVNAKCAALPASGCTAADTPLSASDIQTINTMGGIPNTHYTQNTLKLSASYPLEKHTRVRFDYIYDARKMDDYTWNQWVYADGTKVSVKPEQVTQIVGITLIHHF